MSNFDIKIKKTRASLKPTISQPEREIEFRPELLSARMESAGKRNASRTKKWKYAVLFLAVFVAAYFVFYGSFFIYKITTLGKKVSFSNDVRPNFMSTIKKTFSQEDLMLKGIEQGRINILLMGIAGTDKPGQNLTDTIMIASINTETKQIALFSLPRDLLVSIPETRLQTKINSVYQYGINTYGQGDQQALNGVKKVVEDITSIPIHYFAVLNFEGFEEIINDVGGVNVVSERDILDPRYPGPNYSYEVFELKKGFHQLDGTTALKYVRTRHNDPDGDFGRAKRQQQVMQAVKNKVFSLQTFLNVFAMSDLFNTLGENLRTDLNPEEIESFLRLARTLDTNNINNVVVDAWEKDSLLKVSHVYFGGLRAFILVPRTGNFKEISDLARNVFQVNDLKRKKEEIAKENAKIDILNLSGNSSLASRFRKLLEEGMGYREIRIANPPAQETSETTRFYDCTGGTVPFTLDDLMKKFDGDLATNIDQPNLGAVGNGCGIVILLGKNVAREMSMEENSIDEWKNSQDEQSQTYPGVIEMERSQLE